MKKEAFVYSIVGLVVGGLLVGVSANYAVNHNNQSMMKMMGMHSHDQTMMDNEDMTMGQMMVNLHGKRGDDFDKVFLEEMIMHHQGAIDMAKLAQTGANHNDIKTMANDILRAQSKEIDQMQTWQAAWGYKDHPQTQYHMMDH